MSIFKNKNRFLQYALWLDCSNGCEFCCNKKQKDLNKIDSLTDILKRLDDQQVNQYNEIGFIGGEFFDKEIADPDVKQLFYKLFEKVAKLNKDKIYFTTALIYDIDKLLIPFLDYLRQLNLLEKCLLCTSYDIKHRFHTKEKQNLWIKNVNTIHQLYPQLRIHTQIIVTQYFIDAVLNNEFSITQFQEKYKTRIDYIQPGSGFYYHGKADCQKDIPGFFPTKESFIKFLIKTSFENRQLDLKTFCSMQLRSSKLYYIDGGERCILDNRRDIDFLIVPKNPLVKYEIGLIDSQKSMKQIALTLYNMSGNSFEN